MVIMVSMEQQEKGVAQVIRGLKVQLVNVEQLVHPVFKDHQVTKDSRGSQELKGKKALRARQELQAHLENKDHEGPPETKARKEVRVMLACLESVLKVRWETVVQMAIQEIVEMMERKGNQERMDNQDLQDLLVPQEFKVIEGPRVTRELQEKRQSFRAPKERKVNQVEMVWMELMEPTVNKDLLGSLVTQDPRGWKVREVTLVREVRLAPLVQMVWMEA